MDKKIKMTILFLAIYGLIFWFGFRAGEINHRLKTRVKAEKIQVPQPWGEGRKYFIVQKHNYGNYSDIEYSEVYEKDTRIQFFFNKDLRPLLKLSDVKIYTHKGKRIY